MDAIRPYARTAYAQGWAASGGPMTERVKAGCIAAIAYAVEHADDPRILEATLHLGRIEGIWALIYARRQAHTDAAQDQAKQAWRHLIATVDLAALVRAFLAHPNASLAPGEAPDTGTAIALAQAALERLPNQLEYQQLRRILRDALATGRAEGAADALAIGAAEHLSGLDAATLAGAPAEITAGIGADTVAATFDHVFTGLDRLDELWSEADHWAAKAVGDQASVLGRRLASVARDGGDYDALLSAAEDVLGDGEALDLIVDQAMATSMTDGAIDTYRAAGQAQVSFITAGDDRVCKVCDGLEAGSPYDLLDVPRPPMHPQCRCTLVPSALVRLAADAFGSYATQMLNKILR